MTTRPMTSREVLAEQARDHMKPDEPATQTSVAAFINDNAPETSNRLLKFTKGEFRFSDNGEKIGEDVECLARCDQVQTGWIKFAGPGQPPTREMGLVFSGYILPPRSSLGDTDPSQWEDGLNGRPQDPWQQQTCLPLRRIDSGEGFTFVTSSVTGRRAVATLLRHYERLRLSHPGELPKVNLRVSGFSHRDSRVGWVPVPNFHVIGRATDGLTSPAPVDPLDDGVPFEL